MGERNETVGQWLDRRLSEEFGALVRVPAGYVLVKREDLARVRRAGWRMLGICLGCESDLCYDCWLGRALEEPNP